VAGNFDAEYVELRAEIRLPAHRVERRV